MGLKRAPRRPHQQLKGAEVIKGSEEKRKQGQSDFVRQRSRKKANKVISCLPNAIHPAAEINKWVAGFALGAVIHKQL